MKNLLFIFVLLLVNKSFSQNQLKAEVNAQGIATIEFDSKQQIKEVVLHIHNSKGETVFIEHIEKHQGSFVRTINLKQSGNGTYKLRLLRNEDVFISTLIVQ